MAALPAADPPRAAPMTPVPHRVAWRRAEAADVVTLALEPVAAEPMRWKAGQFNMLYVFAVGEVAISISGNPLDGGPLIHTIRDVGPATRALCSLDAGDTVGVRGPFGRGWELDRLSGGDLVIVAGGTGLAPLRSVVAQLAAQRDRFGEVQLVIGARTPGDILFRDDVDAWRRAGELDVHVTVDHAGREWPGTVGVVTRVLPRLPIAAGASALVCGPEIMMRFTAQALVERGLDPSRIRLSMERNMQCAIGQCGHCQLAGLFICADGPVLTWERMAPLLSVPEL